MPISRGQMNRQLYGVGSLVSREKFGIGSKLKKFVRKIIPNEVADVQPKHTQSSANAKTGGRSVNTLHLTTMQFIHRGTTITKKKRGSVIQICFWFYFKKEVLHTLLTFFWQLQVYQAEKCPPIVPVFNCTRILAGSLRRRNQPENVIR